MGLWGTGMAVNIAVHLSWCCFANREQMPAEVPASTFARHHRAPLFSAGTEWIDLARRTLLWAKRFCLPPSFGRYFLRAFFHDEATSRYFLSEVAKPAQMTLDLYHARCTFFFALKSKCAKGGTPEFVDSCTMLYNRCHGVK